MLGVVSVLHGNYMAGRNFRTQLYHIMDLEGNSESQFTGYRIFCMPQWLSFPGG